VKTFIREGYVENSSGKRVYFENEKNSGSLILFDGATIHGVEDVDLDQVLDFNSNMGRIALFVNLYANNEIKKI
jgi:hypothetical protein